VKETTFQSSVTDTISVISALVYELAAM